MTLAEFDSIRARWARLRPGLEFPDGLIDDVRALIAQLDVEASQLAAAKCLLAEVAGSTFPLAGGIQQRCAAWLQQHGHPDY